MSQDKEMEKSALPKGAILNSGKTEYRIEEVLGAGGFGITYRASAEIEIGNIRKRFDFAIKEHFTKACYRGDNKIDVCCLQHSAKEVAASRADFETEAKRLYELGKYSQHIVKVNESFEANGTYYYVMEYLEGGDLEKYMKSHRNISEADAVALLVPVAKAVALLHSGEKPLLHLDIKPDNIVMKRDEMSGLQIPVLIDFGTAKHFDKKGKPTSNPIAKGATEGFAPMEQYGSIDEFDPRLDVYALGATLYYIITGKRPPKAFDVPNNPISELLPKELSPKIANAIVKAMSPSKFDRTPTVKAFIEQIEKLDKLPLYYELKANTGNYTVTEVLECTENSITYRAVSTGGNIYDTNATVANADYTITEFFDRNSCKRNEDYTVAGVDKNATNYLSFLADVKSKTQLFAISEANETANVNKAADGCMIDEVFFANGTCYHINRRLRKTSSAPKLNVNFKKIFKIAGVFVAAAVLVFVAVKFIKIPGGKEYEPAYVQALGHLENGDTIQAMKLLISENSPEYVDTAQVKIKEITSVIGNPEKELILKVLNDETLKVDAAQLQLVGASYQRLKQYETDFKTIDYELDFSEVEKLIDATVKEWEVSADANPVPAGKAYYYELALMLRPDANIQAKLDKVK